MEKHERVVTCRVCEAEVKDMAGHLEEVWRHLYSVSDIQGAWMKGKRPVVGKVWIKDRHGLTVKRILKTPHGSKFICLCGLKLVADLVGGTECPRCGLLWFEKGTIKEVINEHKSCRFYWTARKKGKRQE